MSNRILQTPLHQRHGVRNLAVFESPVASEKFKLKKLLAVMFSSFCLH